MIRHPMLRYALLAGAATVALALTSCSSGGHDMGGMPGMSGAATASSHLPGGVNNADVMFAQMMIPHHRQAVQMADLAATRAADPQLKTLAAQIKAAQDPEITTMTGWLTTWGQPTAMASGSTMPGMDMSAGATGMMSEQDMAKLAASKGVDFDRLFARMMIAHHQGAIQMAQDEQTNGANADAKALAGRIVTSQQAEVDTLQKILDRL
jgi:uncharacterized protein (DUF305 family)